MENLIKNSNLSVQIGQNILSFLDDDSLKNCRLVNSSMKNMVDDPKYWISKLVKKGLDQEHLKKSRKLVDFVQDSDLIENVTRCLMKMHDNFSTWAQAPIHVATKAGDAILVEIILKHVDDSVAPNKHGNSPMMLAASWGHPDVMKVFISNMNNPNVPDKKGYTFVFEEMQ